jgi:hypothetical protein
LAGSSGPLVVVLEQIQDRRQPGSDATTGLEWPRPVYDVKDDIGIGARPQAIATLEMSEALGRNISLEDTRRDDLQPVLAPSTDATAEDVRLFLDSGYVRGMGTQL